MSYICRELFNSPIEVFVMVAVTFYRKTCGKGESFPIYRLPESLVAASAGVRPISKDALMATKRFGKKSKRAINSKCQLPSKASKGKQCKQSREIRRMLIYFLWINFLMGQPFIRIIR
jgi:membrane-bound lytic murein transglycosylase